MLSLIAALSRNRVIGRDGGLPWRLPRDLRHFRETTLHKPCVMGRKTWETLKEPLEQRRNIVVTRTPGYAAPGAELARSLDEALALTVAAPETMIVGGEALYAEALPRADRLYLTHVHATVEGDAFFPEFDPSAWREIARTDHAADARHAHAFSIVTYQRRER